MPFITFEYGVWNFHASVIPRFLILSGYSEQGFRLQHVLEKIPKVPDVFVAGHHYDSLVALRVVHETAQQVKVHQHHADVKKEDVQYDHHILFIEHQYHFSKLFVFLAGQRRCQVRLVEREHDRWVGRSRTQILVR
jgi:hypothetical protein